MFQCSNAQMFKCSNVQMFECSNVWIFQSSNISIFQCSNVQMFQFSNVPKFQCSNVPMFQCSNVLKVKLLSERSSGHFYINIFPFLRNLFSEIIFWQTGWVCCIMTRPRFPISGNMKNSLQAIAWGASDLYNVSSYEICIMCDMHHKIVWDL